MKFVLLMFVTYFASLSFTFAQTNSYLKIKSPIKIYWSQFSPKSTNSVMCLGPLPKDYKLNVEMYVSNLAKGTILYMNDFSLRGICNITILCYTNSIERG